MSNIILIDQYKKAKRGMIFSAALKQEQRQGIKRAVKQGGKWRFA